MTNPLVYVSIILLVITTIFLIAFFSIKDKKEAFGFDRNMKDGDITKRLLKYAKPYWKRFVFVFIIMIFTIAADLVLPLITGDIVSILQTENFRYTQILNNVILYISLLVLSLICTFTQAMVLQKTGQRIVSEIREELFTHIEKLSHNQLYHIPVGMLIYVVLL